MTAPAYAGVDTLYLLRLPAFVPQRSFRRTLRFPDSPAAGRAQPAPSLLRTFVTHVLTMVVDWSCGGASSVVFRGWVVVVADPRALEAAAARAAAAVTANGMSVMEARQARVPLAPCVCTPSLLLLLHALALCGLVFDCCALVMTSSFTTEAHLTSASSSVCL